MIGPADDPRAGEGPLAGVRALELGGIGPAPFCGMLLADLGAEVIKLERVSSAVAPPESARFEVLNRGRKSVTLDLRQPEGRDIALSLAERCELVYEGFRPGVVERLGVGPVDCMARSPRIVYGRMTGWGQDGPLAQEAGHGINYIGLVGALDAMGPRGGPPVPPLNMLGDFCGGGMFLALGLVSALWESDRWGRGQVVDAAIVDGTASLMGMLMGMRSAGQWTGGRGENLLDGGAHFYGVYQCADDRWISVGAIESKFYGVLLEGLGLQHLEDQDQMDRSQWYVLRDRVSDAFRTRPRDEWVTLFAGRDACVTPVLTVDEAAEHPHNRARGYIRSVRGVVQPGPAPRFSRTPGRGPRPVPHAGDHTDVVLSELGFSESELQALRSRGVVG